MGSEMCIRDSDRAIVLSSGKIIASGSPNEIINDTNARTAYFGDEFKIN